MKSLRAFSVGSFLLILSALSFASFAGGIKISDREEVFLSPWKNDPGLNRITVLKKQTGSGALEVHIQSASSNHKEYSLHVATGLHEIDENWDIFFGDFDGDKIPDLWAILRTNTGSKHSEAHILSGASDFKQFILHRILPIEETGNNFQFKLKFNPNRKPDLVAIKQSGTGSGTTELHVISGESNLEQFSLQTSTGLHETSPDWKFSFGEWKKSGYVDLIIYKPVNSGQIHVLGGQDNYQKFIEHRDLASNPISFKEGLNLDDKAIQAILACAASIADIGEIALLTTPIGWPMVLGASVTFVACAYTYYNWLESNPKLPANPSNSVNRFGNGNNRLVDGNGGGGNGSGGNGGGTCGDVNVGSVEHTENGVRHIEFCNGMEIRMDKPDKPDKVDKPDKADKMDHTKH